MSDDEIVQADPDLDPDVFTVEFACGNCGRLFEESFPAKTRVTTASYSPGVIAKREETEHIECPTCEITAGISIEDRWPVGGETERCTRCAGKGEIPWKTLGGRELVRTCELCGGDGYV